jgi:Ni,Fe-hydrogenase I small subunit
MNERIDAAERMAAEAAADAVVTTAVVNTWLARGLRMKQKAASENECGKNESDVCWLGGVDCGGCE